MRKKNSGFIATSLIYSFFMVFIAILAALLSSYIANKIILERFNGEVESGLNNNTYDIFIRSYNSEIHGGQTINNLIQNGNFKTNTEWWQKTSHITMAKSNFSKTGVLLSNVSRNAYMYQYVPILKNKQYYISFEYSQNMTIPLQVYFQESSQLITNNTNNRWKRISGIVLSKNTNNQTAFSVGKNNLNNYNQARFTNFILINLTDNYGSGNEPRRDWLDENIDYFDGTMSYIKEEQVLGGSVFEAKIVAQSGYNTANLTCIGANNKWISTSRNTKVTYGKDGNRRIAYLTLNNISDNVTCTVRWN